MGRYALKTAYYLNRALRVLALIHRGVRLPEVEGVWVPIADGEVPDAEVTAILAQVYPLLAPEDLAHASLLTDFDVEEFESGRLRGDESSDDESSTG